MDRCSSLYCLLHNLFSPHRGGCHLFARLYFNNRDAHSLARTNLMVILTLEYRQSEGKTIGSVSTYVLASISGSVTCSNVYPLKRGPTSVYQIVLLMEYFLSNACSQQQ